MKKAIFACVLILSGCASDMMQEYVGSDISQVIVKNGPPANTFDMPDGRKAFQWRKDDAFMMPTTTTVTGYGNSATALTSGGGIFSSTCFYTYYAKPNAQKSYTIIGFEKPSLECE